jgi:3-carboxy-cis,cis-muconate cycloisomerase
MNRLLGALAGDPEIEARFGGDAEIAALLRVEGALADAEAEAGLISAAAAAAIARGLASFTPDMAALAAGFAKDGVVVPALVRQLREAVGAEHAGAVHFGATSQDIVDTGLMLRLAEVIAILLARLGTLETAFADLDTRFGARPMMAHTRMQAALPASFTEKIRNWAEPLARERAALDRLRARLLVVQLGGPVGDRASFNGKGDEVARWLAKRLDLGLATPWHNQRDGIVEFGSLLALVSGSLGKFGMDVTLLSQSEARSITLKGGGGSSSMPHKSNPVRAELLVALARFNAGLAGTLQQAMIAENERSGAAWMLEWLVLPQMAVATGKALAVAMALAGEIEVTAPS